MQRAHIECSGPHTLGTKFLRHIIEESIRVWYAHTKTCATLLKARTYTQRARYTHSPPVYLYPWVDIPAIAFW